MDASIDQPINILIVDDEPKNLTVLETVLSDPGYRLIRAESADQALLALVAEEFALLILDIRMPGMTGFELAGMIRERKKTARVPIIFLTAYYNEDQHVLAGYETGAVDYLHKPVNPAILRSKVAVFAELHRKSREVESSNRSLMAEVTARRRAEEQLRQLNETLESRVAERTEALRDADLRKNEFLATLAHELRNPLAPLRTGLEVIRLAGDDRQMREEVRSMMERQLQQMVRLIDDLLDITRITRNKLILRPERIELRQIIQNALETARPLIEQRGHQLTVALPSEPVLLQADPTRIAQVFANLFTNAAKYTEDGGQIWLSAGRDGSEVVVTIRDTGIGIAAEHLPKLFQMFSQAAPALERSQGGLGIGLALVRSLIELHGGSIQARSEGLGQGSEFIVRLPVLTAPEPMVPESAPAPPADQPSRPLRILVVDDNRDIARLLGLSLRLQGHEVHTAHDGQTAVDQAAELQPDTIFLDIGLPVLNGYAACGRIRALSGGERITMIALTGWGQAEDKQRAFEAGFDHHCTKPIDMETLKSMLTRPPLTQ